MGANPNAAPTGVELDDYDASSVLELCCYKKAFNWVQIAGRLLNRGARVQGADLFHVIQSPTVIGAEALAIRMIQRGAPTDYEGDDEDDEDTCLTIAIDGALEKVAIELVSHGADVTHCRKDTPVLRLAIDADLFELGALMLTKGAKVPEEDLDDDDDDVTAQFIKFVWRNDPRNAKLIH